MNNSDVKDLIPHRNSMLILDEVCSIDENSATGTYTVKGTEFFLDGHYPEHQIVPGTILCEIMAQLTAAFISQRHISGMPILTNIKNAKFKQSVFSSDKLLIEMTVLKDYFRVLESSCSIHVGEKLIASAEITVAIV